MKEWCFDKIYSDNLNVEEYQGCVTGRRGPQTGSCMTGSVAAAADRASLCFCSEACLPSPTPDCSVQRWLLATNMSKEHTGASLRATRLKQEVNEMPCIWRPNSLNSRFAVTEIGAERWVPWREPLECISCYPNPYAAFQLPIC